MKNSRFISATVAEEIRTTYEPEVAEYLIRNLHRPLDLELLRTAFNMMTGHERV